eukprot:CAMPEP_0171148316 /NCGR_PEP_ID=MMETSP0766_2-20121228/148506_1 /TAXON_ID=439317 /ORGANISM="Gambierdiscus australes, Strain CAWD 149" /LENGTH=465 /DNA_ID=CAMNT_0011612225 /DNA_START=22 /DNA_END=1419 /DNA_ORIENTATION=+
MSDKEGEEEREEEDEDEDYHQTVDKDFGISSTVGFEGFIKVSLTTVRCRYNPEKAKEEEAGEPESKVRKVEEASEKGLTELQAVAKTTEKLQLLCSRKQQQASLVQLHCSISKAIGESLLHRLSVLRVDQFHGSGDPVFGTKRELRRRYKALEHDLFELLTGTFVHGGKCGLRKLTLQDGFMSAESLMKFLRVAKPPLESFRCRGCLFHGRNFEPIVKTLKASTTSPKGLLEFEMTAYVGGKDPFGLLADAFPNLQMLRTPRIFGETPASAGLERLKSLVKSKCQLPKPNHRLEANCEVGGGRVELFMTSEYHDDGYRGQGLYWDGLRNTCECMEAWRVGKPITKQQVIDFMAECGIGHDSGMDVEKPDSEGGEEPEDDLETIALPVAVEKSPDGLVSIKATALSGREVAAMSAIDPATALVRTIIEELAQKYPCNPLALRLALPDSTTVDVLNKGNETLASVLK